MNLLSASKRAAYLTVLEVSRTHLVFTSSNLVHGGSMSEASSRAILLELRTLGYLQMRGVSPHKYQLYSLIHPELLQSALDTGVPLTSMVHPPPSPDKYAASPMKVDVYKPSASPRPVRPGAEDAFKLPSRGIGT